MKPREFYKSFKPFLDTKAQGTDNRFVNLEVNWVVEKDQATVANQFANHFASVAMAIGDPHLLTSTEDQLMDHTSIQVIRQRKRVIGWYTA